ncbi:serine/threonine protein kinase [Burkholderia gladioli]|uniref:serine/threonine protein kinase n=1 Tax=Burkholderia gladioli TaxID=28095 RepID=UPI001641B561|nr:serine/threonine protein kinase [Burkholderia gladioli]
MSDNIVWVADVEATLEEAPSLAQRGFCWLVQEAIAQSVPGQGTSAYDVPVYRPGTNAAAWSVQVCDDLRQCGIEVRVGRTVFYSCPGPISVRCRHCGATHDQDVPWGNAVSAWYGNEADDSLTCPACSRRERIIDWTFLELDWAFGNLGFGFHNWPIADRLSEELGRVLGHRIKIAYQHY